MKKAGNDFCELPLKAPEEVKEEVQEVTVSPATAKEISIDIAVEAVLSTFNDFFQQEWH